MPSRMLFLVATVGLVGFAALRPTSVVQAEWRARPQLAGSPLELVNAVNGLRTSYGLPPYSINPILMSTAQAQADFLALTGSMTHSGPGGISLTDRLLAAGYPLAGDLSLGGFRAENITGGPEEMPAEAAVNRWTGDTLHLNTMISPDLTEIGAGVAVNNGRVYYVIDAARPTTGSEPQSTLDPAGNMSPVASPPGVIFPVTLSTPNAAGELIHEVKAGQSLWLIAIAYETKIDEIRSLNSLPDNDIYPGQRLLIRRGALLPTALSSETPMPPRLPTLTSLPALPSTHITSMAVPDSGARSSRSNHVSTLAAVGILVLALLGGGIFAWLGTSGKSRNH